jgi:hypothetical protein
LRPCRSRDVSQFRHPSETLNPRLQCPKPPHSTSTFSGILTTDISGRAFWNSTRSHSKRSFGRLHVWPPRHDPLHAEEGPDSRGPTALRKLRALQFNGRLSCRGFESFTHSERSRSGRVDSPDGVRMLWSVRVAACSGLQLRLDGEPDRPPSQDAYELRRKALHARRRSPGRERSIENIRRGRCSSR